MIIKRKQIIVDERPDTKIIEATCDICGADCMKEMFEPMKSDGDRDEHDINKTFEGMILKAIWGYWSDNDGEIWEAVICEKCVKKHLENLIPFVKRPY